eukprot:GHVN01051602.1.p1 GENE.GHVN01051602.1~~GHVN01051602.1.p1  ORF type:complete len:100 (+),score=7.08 GHVN01051602.1:280-579(+)
MGLGLRRSTPEDRTNLFVTSMNPKQASGQCEEKYFNGSKNSETQVFQPLEWHAPPCLAHTNSSTGFKNFNSPSSGHLPGYQRASTNWDGTTKPLHTPSR